MVQRSSKEAPVLWEVVELTGFVTPEHTQASQWRRSWLAATRWLVGREAAEHKAKQESELRALPEVRLAHLVPDVDWTPGARALAQVLLQQGLNEEPVVFFITPPYGGHSAVVKDWAEQQGVSCLASPTYQELSEGTLEWLARCENQHRWALPALERCFLRHTQGLQGVRALLERALSGRMGRGVIGCDSWTYAYLQQAIGLDGAPALTLQAVEGQQLAYYFAHLADGGGYPTVYSTRTGNPILENDADDNAENGRKTVHKELQRLAAHCRGHLGIAWHYWRERLREPAESSDSMQSQNQSPNVAPSEELWLMDALAEAELPAETGDLATLLLHALLIHGGLEDQALGDVLPFSHHEVLNARLSLARKGLLVCHQGRWQVAPLSYASVRQLLESRNYLVDAL
ncbi:hypothetical protein LG301_03765 [Vreelandella venusta]|uniref:hypothetical protein n=1 Tax=Vreelandella venusta TaxID=44935 RepID=UPI003850F6A8